MFAPPDTHPPYFSSIPNLAKVSDEISDKARLSAEEYSVIPPYKVDYESKKLKIVRKKDKANFTNSNNRYSNYGIKKKKGVIVVHTADHTLLIHLQTPTLLQQLAQIHNTNNHPSTSSSATAAALLTLYNKINNITTTPNPEIQPHGVNIHKIRFSLLLRCLQLGILLISVQDVKLKEELDVLSNCCCRVSGLFILKINGRMTEADNEDVHYQTKIRKHSNKRTALEQQTSINSKVKVSSSTGQSVYSAEEHKTYTAQQLSKSLPICIHHNTITLYHIDLHGLLISDWSPFVHAFSHLPHLHHLYIRQCYLSDETAIDIINAASTTPTLTHFSLSNNGLTDAICVAVCRMLVVAAQRREVMEWQRTLRTSTNPTKENDPDARSSTRKPKNASIREQGLISLDLSLNELTDTGITMLIDGLKDDPWLQAIFLHQNQHTIVSVQAFMKMTEHNTSLLVYTLIPATVSSASVLSPPLSPRSPRSPRPITAASSSTSALFNTLYSWIDPHQIQRQQQQKTLYERRRYMLPSVIITQESHKQRYGIGRTGAAADTQKTVEKMTHSLLSIRESCMAVPINEQVACIKNRRIIQQQEQLKQQREKQRHQEERRIESQNKQRKQDQQRITSAAQHDTQTGSKRAEMPPIFTHRPRSRQTHRIVDTRRQREEFTPNETPMRRHLPISDSPLSPPFSTPSPNSIRDSSPLPPALTDLLIEHYKHIDQHLQEVAEAQEQQQREQRIINLQNREREDEHIQPSHHQILLRDALEHKTNAVTIIDERRKQQITDSISDQKPRKENKESEDQS